MSLANLRAAITTVGGTPTAKTHRGLWEEYVTALGGSPTKVTVTGLVKEAITAAGGTPTRHSYIPLLRELITTLGGTPTGYRVPSLVSQLSVLALPGGLEYVGGKAALANTGANTTISLGDLAGGLAEDPVEGDIVILGYGIGAGSIGIAMSVVTAGYTTIARVDSADTDRTNFLTAYKVMGATPDTEVVVSPTGGVSSAGVVTIQVWRGVDTGTPLDVARTTATGTNGTAVDPAAITPVTEGAVIIAMAAQSNDQSMSAFTSSDLENLVQNQHAASTQRVRVVMGSAAWTGGAFNPAAFGGGTPVDVAASWAAVTVALRPA